MIIYVTTRKNLLPPILFWDDYHLFSNLDFLVTHYSCLHVIDAYNCPFICIFCDLDILPDEEIGKAKVFCNHLKSTKSYCRVFNDPSKVLNRFELLKQLNEYSINTFKAYKLDADYATFHYPVFIRSDKDHSGSKSKLLYTPQEVSGCLASLIRRGIAEKDLIIIEFVNTRNEELGLYIKYSVFRYSELYTARHVLFNNDWEVKYTHIVNNTTIKIEKEYSKHIPELSKVKAIFNDSGIEYGRIDYGIANGNLQVWEINTNPTLNISKKSIYRLGMTAESSFKILKEFESIYKDLEIAQISSIRRHQWIKLKIKFLIYLDRLRSISSIRQVLWLFYIRMRRLGVTRKLQKFYSREYI